MAISVIPPKIRRKIPNAAVLRRMYEEASALSGSARNDAFNRLADVTGLAAPMLAALTPQDAQKTFLGIGDAGREGTTPTQTQQQVMVSIPPKLGTGTTMGAVKHAMKTPAVNVESMVLPDQSVSQAPVTNLDALRTGYGDKGTEAILSKMAERQEEGTGGEIMQSNLTKPVLVTADPTITAQGTSNEATGTITLNPEVIGAKLTQGDSKAAEAKTVQQEEFTHNVANTVGPRGQSQFWKTAEQKGFVGPSQKNPYLWEQKGVAKYSARDYDRNAEEARAKLVTVARRIGAHPDMLAGGFDEWLKLAEKRGYKAIGDPVMFQHVIGPMVERDAKGNYTPAAKRAQEWGKLVFQNWAANAPQEKEQAVGIKDGGFVVDGVA